MSIIDLARMIDPETPCDCGHLAMNHHLRKGIYMECPRCPNGACPKFMPDIVMRVYCPCGRLHLVAANGAITTTELG